MSLTASYSIHTLSFCLTRSFFQSYSKLNFSRLGQSSKVNFWELLWQNFYRLLQVAAIPVISVGTVSFTHWVKPVG